MGVAASVLVVLAALASANGDDKAPACEPCCSGPTMPLSSFAHAGNEEFISRATGGQRVHDFRATVTPTVIGLDGRLHLFDQRQDRILTYASDNGWNNQLLNLLCAIDMARSLNRTLLVPSFQWKRRRGPAEVSVARLIDVRHLASLGVRVLFEDEQGSVSAALTVMMEAQGLRTETLNGQGQPHRKKGMPRWDREGWIEKFADHPAGIIRISCCLFWTWSLPEDIARDLYAHLHYHPALVAAARAAAAPLGARFGAMHVRRGDKAKVDKVYAAMFANNR
uniref:O-fucosyltransferase family protein n=1 Tax=Haptolina brevifila TaxID=156173 RepID=A0A7S2JP01_9EUKA